MSFCYTFMFQSFCLFTSGHVCLLGKFCYLQLLNKPLGDAKRLELNITEDTVKLFFFTYPFLKISKPKVVARSVH